jgi:hypothetical protein
MNDLVKENNQDPNKYILSPGQDFGALVKNVDQYWL